MLSAKYDAWTASTHLKVASEKKHNKNKIKLKGNMQLQDIHGASEGARDGAILGAVLGAIDGAFDGAKAIHKQIKHTNKSKKSREKKCSKQ